MEHSNPHLVDGVCVCGCDECGRIYCCCLACICDDPADHETDRFRRALHEAQSQALDREWKEGHARDGR